MPQPLPISLRRSLLAAGILFAVGCGAETRIAVENQSDSTSKIEIRNPDNDSDSEVRFDEVAPGARTDCRSIDYPSYTSVQVNGTDNVENGAVDLAEGADNLIVVYTDGTEPTASVVEDGLCD